MNNDKWMFGLGGLVVGLLLATWFANYAVNSNRVGMMSMMGMRSSMMQNGNVDRHFIEQMIPHHEDAIAMADIALQKAEHQEIKQLSENIKKSQSAEIEWMKKWYKEWFGQEISLIPIAFAHGDTSGMGTMQMQKGMMGGQTDLERLKNAQPFDKAFIEEMIPHHQMAIMMAEMLQRSTTRSEMKELAHDIIDAQSTEIEQMRNWYSQWYK